MGTINEYLTFERKKTRNNENQYSHRNTPLPSRVNINFQHFLITQFNLKQFWATTDNDQKKWLEWTENRIGLFQTYCLPSVLNQKNQNFSWVIFADRSTPAHLIKKLAGMTASSPQIKWCFMDGYDDFKARYMTHIQDLAHPDVEWIVTTNLDNDDALHRDAIDTIQQHVVPNNNHLISLANGYCMDLKSKKLSQYFYPRSPFLSLIEKNTDDAKGIHYLNHTKWENIKLHFYQEVFNRLRREKDEQVTYVMNHPLWIQMVHGQNVSNSLYRGVPVTNSINLSAFGLSQFSQKMKWVHIFKYRSYYLWKRYVFCLILKTLPREKLPVHD